MNAQTTRDVLIQTGLWGWPPFHRDLLFWLASAIGAGVSLFLHSVMSMPTPERSFLLLFSMILWQPALEEIFFRGIVQGRFLQTAWGTRRRWGISAANAGTSLLFTALHFIYHPPLWALSVLVPSLVFGFFRERHASTYPPLVLHAAYNAFYLFLFL